jgi:hypothetical protein
VEPIRSLQEGYDLIEPLETLPAGDKMPVDACQNRQEAEAASSCCDGTLIVSRINIIQMDPFGRHPTVWLGAFPEILESL